MTTAKPETLLEQLGERLGDVERRAEQLNERLAVMEALAGRGMHPEEHEGAINAAGQLLDLARRLDRLEAALAGIDRRTAVLETLERSALDG
jgi:hypothetical protein